MQQYEEERKACTAYQSIYLSICVVLFRVERSYMGLIGNETLFNPGNIFWVINNVVKAWCLPLSPLWKSKPKTQCHERQWDFPTEWDFQDYSHDQTQAEWPCCFFVILQKVTEAPEWKMFWYFTYATLPLKTQIKPRACFHTDMQTKCIVRQSLPPPVIFSQQLHFPAIRFISDQ